MVLALSEPGLSSCIIARGEETFDHERGAALLQEWNTYYVARRFTLLGYCEGEYPKEKLHKADRIRGIKKAATEHKGFLLRIAI